MDFSAAARNLDAIRFPDLFILSIHPYIGHLSVISSHRRRAGILSFVLVFKMQAPTYPSLYCATLIMIGTFYEWWLNLRHKAFWESSGMLQRRRYRCRHCIWAANDGFAAVPRDGRSYSEAEKEMVERLLSVLLKSSDRYALLKGSVVSSDTWKIWSAAARLKRFRP